MAEDFTSNFNQDPLVDNLARQVITGTTTLPASGSDVVPLIVLPDGAGTRTVLEAHVLCNTADFLWTGTGDGSGTLIDWPQGTILDVPVVRADKSVFGTSNSVSTLLIQWWVFVK